MKKMSLLKILSTLIFKKNKDARRMADISDSEAELLSKSIKNLEDNVEKEAKKAGMTKDEYIKSLGFNF